VSRTLSRMFPAATSLNFLRASLLVLLVLGLVVKPVLNQLGELHSVEHAALADADEHGHDHAGDQDDEPGQDHAKGAHGLMHQANLGASSDVLPTLAIQPLPSFSLALPMPDCTAAPRLFAATPFRPPIA
jgi:hypothetical protein